MDKLSAVIISYNEEKNIARCIESLKKVADEILVVDSFSKDKTEEICKKMGVVFHQRAWDNFSAQKNYGNSLASYNYILSIDADEVLSDSLAEEILAEKAEFKYDAYGFPRLTYFLGKAIRHCGWYPDTKIRLWNKNKGEWQGTVHETLSFNSDYSSKILKGDLLHFTTDNLYTQIEKINKYTDAHAKNIIEKGGKAGCLKLLFKPGFKFFKIYILRLGFLDGFEGFLISRLSAIDAFLRLSKIRIGKKNKNEQ